MGHADRTPRLTGTYTGHDPSTTPSCYSPHLAAATERMNLATGILALPQTPRQRSCPGRRPMLASCPAVGCASGGVSWNHVEYEALGQDFRTPRRPAGGADRAASPVVHRTRRHFTGRFHRVDRVALGAEASTAGADPATTLTAVVTSNTALAAMPGNVFLPAAATGLPRDSVVNVTALVTVDKGDIDELIGRVPDYLMQEVDRGLRQVLGV